VTTVAEDADLAVPLLPPQAASKATVSATTGTASGRSTRIASQLRDRRMAARRYEGLSPRRSRHRPAPPHAYSSAIASTARLLLDLLRRPERHSYGDHPEQRADLYLPPGEGPHPVVVVIHGGSWRARYGKLIMKPVCTDLRRRGLAAWNIEYRRLGRGQGGGWPATFDDVAAAIDHLAELRDPRLDLGSLAMVGHSAGGQLALWAASRTDSRVPIGRVCGQAAVCDLVSAGASARELMGGGPDEVPERYARADPMQLVPLGVPILLVHGPADATVPFKRSRRFAEAARAAGDDVTLVESNPGGHRTHVDPRSAAWHVAADWLASG
jgi:acetyl esterase/lipase